MDIALVEHAQHDVDGDQRGENQARLIGQRSSGRRRPCPGSCAWMLAGKSISLLGLIDGLDGVAQRTPGARLKESVTTGKLPMVIDRQAAC